MRTGKKKKGQEEHENVERWMVSYADFVTLLFCFFTAMYAISNVDTNKLGKFVESMRVAFNDSGSRGNAFAVIEGVQLFVPTDVELEADVKRQMGTLLSESRGGIEVSRDHRGVTISVVDKFFYESGSADIKKSARRVLDSIAAILNRYPNMIRIEGHTDNIPIHNKNFPSNWELSAGRAISVAKYLIDNHDVQPGRISTIGFAEHRPIASNDTFEGRAKNRRVDIVILSDAESRKEPA